MMRFAGSGNQGAEPGMTALPGMERRFVPACAASHIVRMALLLFSCGSLAQIYILGIRFLQTDLHYGAEAAGFVQLAKDQITVSQEDGGTWTIRAN